MVFVDNPSKEEKKLLQEQYQKSSSRFTRTRAHAVLLSSEQYTVPTIAHILMQKEKNVRTWIHVWNGQRISSIFHQHVDNQHAAKLTKEQKTKVAQTLRTPDSLPDEFWSLPKLKEHISSTFGIVYESDRSYHYILKHTGLSWKLPTPFDIRRDEKHIAKRMHDIKREIEPYMKDADWEVLVSDEVRIDWEEETRRAWLPAGKKAVIKLERTKTGQSYFGALSLKTKKHHLISLDWQDTDNIISALTQLQKKYSDTRICMIWDNAPWHKSKALREELTRGGLLASYHLINFPPYAPDENPQEHVWKYGKEKIANTHFASFMDLKNEFKKRVNNKIFDYKM